jgi:hypothetical protein
MDYSKKDFAFYGADTDTDTGTDADDTAAAANVHSVRVQFYDISCSIEAAMPQWLLELLTKQVRRIVLCVPLNAQTLGTVRQFHSWFMEALTAAAATTTAATTTTATATTAPATTTTTVPPVCLLLTQADRVEPGNQAVSSLLLGGSLDQLCRELGLETHWHICTACEDHGTWDSVDTVLRRLILTLPPTATNSPASPGGKFAATGAASPRDRPPLGIPVTPSGTVASHSTRVSDSC